jgi:splicing factor 3B subunit 4
MTSDKGTMMSNQKSQNQKARKNSMEAPPNQTTTTTAKETSVYVGNLDDRCSESLLYELFLQVGIVRKVHIPRDRLTQVQQGYGFVELGSAQDADYACRVLAGVKLFNRPLKVARMNQAGEGPSATLDVGANLFVGNLDPSLDESALAETFGVFGRVRACKVARDLETGLARGYAFLSFDSFEASDAALESMHGQYLGNKPVSVSYAYRKDRKGERHGCPEERQLAAEARKQASSLCSGA